MSDYADLIKLLRNCAENAAPCDDCGLAADHSCSDTLMKQAADAIEELSSWWRMYGALAEMVRMPELSKEKK